MNRTRSYNSSNTSNQLNNKPRIKKMESLLAKTDNIKVNKNIELSEHNYFFNFIKLCIEIFFVFILGIPKLLLNILKPIKNKDINGQLALVTGGGNGLGREICIQLAQNGCNVVIADVDLTNATTTAKLLNNKYKVNAKAYKVDVSNYDEVKRLKNQIDQDFGIVDILVNNAGLMPLKSSIYESTKEEIEKTFAVNVTSHIWTLQFFLDGMRKRKRGHIVAISSVAGLIAVPFALAYTSSKFAVKAMMEGLRTELNIYKENNIKTTTVYPYFIQTNPDLVNYLETNNTLKYHPALTPTQVAEQILDGILKNKKNVVIPKYFKILAHFSRLVPDNITYRFTKTILPINFKENIKK